MDVGLLTYASFTAPGEPGAGGGWRVGQCEGGLSDGEVRQLCGRIPTRLPGTRPVPRYPSAEEVFGLERRMAWTSAPWGGGDRVFWFSTPAGEDGTGRAGNVFTQVYVFREGDPRPTRPSDLLFSPSLELPFGATEVNAATVAAGAPEPGTLADPEALWPWILAPAEVDRMAVLRVLLDCLAAGRPTVVACPDDEAAMWIAAVHLATSPRVARDLTFSTLERAGGLADAVRHGIRLLRVPPVDAAAAAAVPGVAVVDTTREPRPGEFGHSATVLTDEPGAPGADAAVTASAWSALADLLLRDPVAATAISRSARETPPGADPAWFLALAALDDPDRAPAAAPLLAELLAAALARHAEPGELLARLEPFAAAGMLRPGSAASARVIRALREHGIAALATAPGALAELIPGDPGPAMRRLLRESVAGSPELAEALVAGRGLPVDAARWLGIPERTAELLPTPPAGVAVAGADFALPGPQGALIGAWVLGELRAGTPVAAPSRRSGSGGGANPWADGADAAATAGGVGVESAFTAPVVAFGLNCLVKALGELERGGVGPHAVATALPAEVDSAVAGLAPEIRALLDAVLLGGPGPEDRVPVGGPAMPAPGPPGILDGPADLTPAVPAGDRGDAPWAPVREPGRAALPEAGEDPDPLRIAEQPGIPTWVLKSICDAAGRNLTVDAEMTDLAGGAPQWHCLLGEVLRLPRRDGGELVREAQELVLASAAVHVLCGGEPTLVDTLPWWRVDRMDREELALLAGRAGRQLLEYGGPDRDALATATGTGPPGRCRLAQRAVAAHDRILRRRREPGHFGAETMNRSEP